MKLDKTASHFEFGSEFVKLGWCELKCVVLDAIGAQIEVHFKCLILNVG